MLNSNYEMILHSMAGSVLKRRQIEEKGASLGPRSESLGPRSESFFFYLAASEIRCNSPEYYPNGYFYQFYHSNGYIYRSNGFITGASLLDLGAIFFFAWRHQKYVVIAPGTNPTATLTAFIIPTATFIIPTATFIIPTATFFLLQL